MLRVSTINDFDEMHENNVTTNILDVDTKRKRVAAAKRREKLH